MVYSDNNNQIWTLPKLGLRELGMKFEAATSWILAGNASYKYDAEYLINTWVTFLVYRIRLMSAPAHWKSRRVKLYAVNVKIKLITLSWFRSADLLDQHLDYFQSECWHMYWHALDTFNFVLIWKSIKLVTKASIIITLLLLKFWAYARLISLAKTSPHVLRKYHE